MSTNLKLSTAEAAAPAETCLTIEAGLDTLKGKALAEQNTLKDEELLNELSNLSPYDFDYATLNLTSQYKRIVQGNMLYVLWAHYTKKGAYIFSCPKATSFKVSVDPFCCELCCEMDHGQGRNDFDSYDAYTRRRFA